MRSRKYVYVSTEEFVLMCDDYTSSEDDFGNPTYGPRKYSCCEIASGDAAYAEWLRSDHRKIGIGSPHLASGEPSVGSGRCDGTYQSDVDVSILVLPPTLDIVFRKLNDTYCTNECSISDHRADGYLTAKFIIRGREVNVRYTTDEPQLRRVLQHRMNELSLALRFPELAERVRALKITPDGKKAMGTEPAWASILAPGIGDAYGYMAGNIEDLIKAAQIAHDR